MKYISEKSEVFENIDIIYKKLRYQRRKSKIEGKQIWQELYEKIPYHYILKNEEILDLIVNICKDNYKDNLSLLKKLINECEETKYYKSEKIIDEEDKEQEGDGVKEEKEFDIQNNIQKEEEVKPEKYWIDFKWNKNDKSIDEEDFYKQINQADKYYSKIKNKYTARESYYEENLTTNDYLINNVKDEVKYKLERVKGITIPHRKEIKLNKIVRSSSIVKTLKVIYKDTCQICGTRLEIAPEVYYSEVHHIRPLGKLHKGSDTTGNAIVLCPNCHILFDKGSIGIDEDTFHVISFNKNDSLNNLKVDFKHELDIENIKYHNNNIYVDRLCSEKINNDFEVKIQQKLNNNSVDYGDIVEILDLDLNEIIIVNMKSYWEQNDMSPLQRKLLNKKVDDIVSFNQYKYKIGEIKKA